MHHFMIDHILDDVQWYQRIIEKAMNLNKLYSVVIQAERTAGAIFGRAGTKPSNFQVKRIIKVLAIKLAIECNKIVNDAFCTHFARIEQMRVIDAGHVFINKGLHMHRNHLVIAPNVAGYGFTNRMRRLQKHAMQGYFGAISSPFNMQHRRTVVIDTHFELATYEILKVLGKINACLLRHILSTPQHP